MVAKLEITLGYQKEDNHDHLYNVRTFGSFEDRLICTHKGVGEKGYLFVRFNVSSINFKVLPEDFQPMETEPLVECEFKLYEISRETRDYLKIVKDRKSKGLSADIREDDGRIKIHDLLSAPIDQRLADNQIEYVSGSKPTRFSKKLISAWFKQIALCEDLGIAQPPQSIGSFNSFLHKQSLT